MEDANFSPSDDKEMDAETKTQEQTRVKEANEFFMKTLDYPVLYDEERCETTVSYPGLMYDDYDMNTRKPKLWKLMKIINACYIPAYEKPMDETGRTFRDLTKRDSGSLGFMLSGSFTFTRDLYDVNKTKGPLKVKTRQGYIGHTSVGGYNILMTLSGTPLMTHESLGVRVNPMTKRPIPLPGWWKDKYSLYAVSKVPLKINKSEKPNNAPSCEVRVGFSDTDNNSHVNWASYVRFAMDAAHLCAKRNQLKHYIENLRRGVKRMQILFLSESFGGDILTVYVWENNANHSQLMTHACKGDVLVCQVSFFFFDDDVKSSL